jgi:hypothetical protein
MGRHSAAAAAATAAATEATAEATALKRNDEMAKHSGASRLRRALAMVMTVAGAALLLRFAYTQLVVKQPDDA